MNNDSGNRLLIASIPPPPRIIGEIARPLGAPPIMGCFMFLFFFGIFALIGTLMNVHREIEAQFHEVKEIEGRITDVDTRYDVEINDRHPRILSFEYVDPKTYATVSGSIDTLDFALAEQFEDALDDAEDIGATVPVTIEYVPGRPELATIAGMPRTLMAWWIGLFLLIPFFISLAMFRGRARATSRLRNLLERGQSTTGEVTKVDAISLAAARSPSRSSSATTPPTATRMPGARQITRVTATFNHPIAGQTVLTDRTADPEFGPETIKVGDHVTIVFDEINATNATIPVLHRVRF